MGSALAPPKTSREALSPLMVSVISFLVINTLIVVARAVSRLYLAKLSFWWDDLCILVGYVVLVAMGAVILVVVRVEVDYSPLDALVADLAVMETLAKLIYAYLLLLTASFAATRLAILALYLRIFQAKRLRRIIWAVVTLVALQYIAFTLVTIFACWPVYKFWTPTPHNEGTCINRGTFLRTMTPFNIAIDAVLVILPLPTVWQLKATRFRKWALTFVFGLGIIALVVSAIRLATIDSNPIGVRTSPSNTNALFLWVYGEFRKIIHPSSRGLTGNGVDSGTICILGGSMPSHHAPHYCSGYAALDLVVAGQEVVLVISSRQELRQDVAG